MNHKYKSYLFNFSASYSRAGLKRLLAYSKWFNENGGARFIVNYRLKEIENTFPENHYHFLRQNSLERALNYSHQLNRFIAEAGAIDLYYSYAIPLPYKPGRANWFHLGNVLLLTNKIMYVPLRRYLELQLLELLTKNGLRHADIISAESESSLELFNKSLRTKLVVSVNGSDDEIEVFKERLNLKSTSEVDNIAVAVGTHRYKCIDDVYKTYVHLRQSNPGMRLFIVGEKEDIPSYILKDNLVILQGLLSQPQVCTLLKSAKYYITSTIIENSYNAASEGAYLAREAFVSDIGPHRELLKGMKFKVVDNLNTRVASFHVHRKDLSVNNLKSWDQVIVDMIHVVENKLSYS